MSIQSVTLLILGSDILPAKESRLDSLSQDNLSPFMTLLSPSHHQILPIEIPNGTPVQKELHHALGCDAIVIQEKSINRMEKCRAVAKLQSALPKTPHKRKAVLSSVSKSPTVTKLQSLNIVITNNTNHEYELGQAVLNDIASAIKIR